VQTRGWGREPMGIPAPLTAAQGIPQELAQEIGALAEMTVVATVPMCVFVLQARRDAAMDANTVTAICATAIASASFAVSVQQGRAVRKHNRHSVLPVLQICNQRRVRDMTGMSLHNHGLGPAFVTHSKVWLDGVHVGQWDWESMELLRSELRETVRVTEMNRRPWILPAGSSRSLLSVDHYDDGQHGDMWDLIVNRLAVEFTYQSIYGGEDFRLSYRLETVSS
ncbi:hypothetical protein OHA43_44580, partial [Streptomyces sp. NBC_00305]